MDRDNSAWLAHLRSDGADQQSALSELREILLRSLRRGMSSRPHVNDHFLEDAVQDALLRILDRLDQFEGRSGFLTWATSIAVHIAMSQLRRRRWKDISLDEIDAGGDFTPQSAVDPDLSPEVQFERSAVLETLNLLMDLELTTKQRTALQAELKGMPLDEIARQLGSNRNAVYKLTHDARRKLKSGLEAAGFNAEDIPAATST